MGCGSSSPDKAAADEEHKAPDVGGAGGIAPQTQSDARTDDTTNSSPLRRQPTMADAVAAAAKAGEAAAAVKQADVAVSLVDAVQQSSRRLLAPLGLGDAAPKPEDATTDLQRYATSLLEGLHNAKETPPLPIKTHSERLNSGDRGLSLAMLRALRVFYDEHNGLDKVMGDVCKEEGFGASVVALTRSTGLSLAESLVHVAEGDERVKKLVGRATTFFSYSWTGTILRDQLWAVEQKLVELEAEDGVTRYVWIDMYAASQNLLAGVFKDEAITKETDPAGYKARKEDTDNIFGDALKAVDELLLYSSPLMEEWMAPLHSFLLSDRGEPLKDWVRRGPGAITRAWCLFEIVEALANGCKLHVVLNQKDTEGFEDLLTEQFDEVAKILAGVDARDAQISKVEDREYILGEIEKLEGGVGYVNAVVVAALRGWLQGAARRCLEAKPKGERGTSKLINQVAMMLKQQGEDWDGWFTNVPVASSSSNHNVNVAQGNL